jgi:outer membrane protein assembly factor BamB
VYILTAIKTDKTIDPKDVAKPPAGFDKRTTPPTNFYKFHLMSFDRDTGKLHWEDTVAEKVPHEGHHTTHSYAAGSPTTDGKFLYASFGSFGTYCYSLDGRQIWARDLGKLNTRLGWGEAVTPVVHGDKLFLNWDQEADSLLICLDAKTGEVKWKAERVEKTSWNTPLVVEHKGKTQVIVNGKERIRAHDAETGKVIWECGGMSVNPIPSAVVNGDVVYCMSNYQGAAAAAISLDAVGDVSKSDKVLWRYAKGTPYVPSPVLVGDRLWFTERNEAFLTTLDVKTGQAKIDRERLTGVSNFYASPVAAADRVYFVDRQGTTLVLKQGDKLEILATNTLGEPVDASPVLVGKSLFLRGEKNLYCIEEK